MGYCFRIFKSKAAPFKVKVAVFFKAKPAFPGGNSPLCSKRLLRKSEELPKILQRERRSFFFIFSSSPSVLNMLAAWHSMQPSSPAASPVSAEGTSEVKITQQPSRKEKIGEQRKLGGVKEEANSSKKKLITEPED